MLESGERAVSTRLQSTWAAFSNFALRDNVLEVAVGLIFASSFTAVVNSFVSDILLPIISLLPFISRNLDEQFLVLKDGHQDVRYNTLQQALDDGAVVWAYGSFLDKVFRFFLIALALFGVGRFYGWATGDKVIKRQVKCKYCRKYISEKVRYDGAQWVLCTTPCARTCRCIC